MKNIWYQFIKIYIRTGLFFFFKEIAVHGADNIPKKGAILLVSNHKNALIDPLLIATNTTRSIHFLTRASAFKIRIVKWILSTVNMLPIYRMRDGKETLAKNEEIFNTCYQILENKRSLLIFPEGTHDIRRWVRPLSKGFTRIAFGFFERHPTIDLQIIPVGLNYSNASHFGNSVSIYFGKPILANPYYTTEDLPNSTNKLKSIVGEKMKELTTHIEIENYERTIEKLGAVDFLNPYKVNQYIKEPSSIVLENKASKEPSLLYKGLKLLVMINSFIPLLIYKSIEPSIKEIEFVSTTKFAIGVTAAPLFYLLQSYFIYAFFGFKIAILYLITSIVMVLILSKTNPK